MRLDLALIAVHPELSRRKAREVIEKGQVTLRGETVQEPGRLVRPGEAVVWDPNRPARPRARISLPLLYRDDSMVVIDKPAGLLAVPSAPDAENEDTAVARVHEFAAHLNPRHPYVGVVHRLDRDTSGALAFALTATARGALRALFREHRMERRYAALVEGIPPTDEGVIEIPISESYEGKRRVARPGEPSLPARTRWRVVQRFPGGALLEVELDTGRQHQIRVHLSHVGLPIVGDPVYQKETRRHLLDVPRQMLHARVLGFIHPLTGATVRCESPLPEDFKTALRQLRQQKARPTPTAPGPASTQAPSRPFRPGPPRRGELRPQAPPSGAKNIGRGRPRSRSPR